MARSVMMLFATAGATFTVTDDSYGDVQLKVLSNTETGERASVIVNYGGCVDELWLTSPGASEPRKVLWDHERNATAVKYNPTWKGRMLLPYANRIANATYMFNGTLEHLPVNDVDGLPNALHGLLWNKSMTVASANGVAAGASVALEHAFDGTDPGYPFALNVRIEYTLTQKGFEMSVAATNQDPSGWALPFYNGWHPYFLVSDVSRAKIVLDNCTRWAHVDVHQGPQYPPPRHSDMVPSGHVSAWDRDNGTNAIGGSQEVPTYMDDEVKALQPCEDGYETRLVDAGGYETTVLSHDRSFGYLQIFTGAKSSWGADAVVLEPLSAMSDAYNNHDGLHVISAGETFVSRFGVRLESSTSSHVV